MKFDWNQPTEEARRQARWQQILNADHNMDIVAEIDRSYLMAALCDTELTDSEYHTVDFYSNSGYESLLNLASILRKVYAHGVSVGKAAVR